MPTSAELSKLCREWTPASLVAFYEWVFADLNFKLPDHLYPVVLGLCDTRIKKLMYIVAPGAGKSQLLSIAYPAWLLGHDPTNTVLGVSGGEALIQGFQNAVMQLIEASPVWKLTFPEVRPDKNSGWSTDAGMFVTGRKPGIPDASYYACGVGSRALTGKHGKTIILDDIHNKDNSETSEQCKKVCDVYYNTILGRADPMGSRSILAGRRWHEDDIYGQLQNSEEWVVVTLPAERPGVKNLFVDVHVPDGLECVFTDGMVFCGDGSVALI